MLEFKKQLGLVRSFMIYYMKPFNGMRLKNFYRDFINEGDLCFDLGAHLGNRSNTWLKLGASVVAVEPQPSCIGYLEKRFKNKASFVLVKKAVGSKAEKTDMKISSLFPTISTLSDQWQHSKDKPVDQLNYWDDKVTIEVTTLDSLIEEFGIPKFCKIDVEDFELEVLKGLSHTIPSLSFEFLPARSHKAVKCIEQLQKLGKYQFNLSYRESLKFEFSDWLNHHEIKKIMANYKTAFSGDIYAKIED